MIMSAGICPGGVRYINTSPAVNASPAPERCLFKYSGAGEMCINSLLLRRGKMYIGLNTSSAPEKCLF